MNRPSLSKPAWLELLLGGTSITSKFEHQGEPFEISTLIQYDADYTTFILLPELSRDEQATALLNDKLVAALENEELIAAHFRKVTQHIQAALGGFDRLTTSSAVLLGGGFVGYQIHLCYATPQFEPADYLILSGNLILPFLKKMLGRLLSWDRKKLLHHFI